ncbi:ABC transporter domain-containing protein [Trichoderma breve]|uniref:ABC transporter domain-containing protein n=1 Tax=Trichoderma breve TaxID=2034170 RepID=A0A9W9B2N3_9HYPO|nr:ABC transporter domain-containing protein [Trichoderma breve]KAJ4854603.1 ABC transporter domain-containing protein [Trichoderma breve]
MRLETRLSINGTRFMDGLMCFNTAKSSARLGNDDPMAKPLSDCKGKVEFRSVRFSYDKKTNILEDLNLDVEPGATIAVVGLSGQGKSTLLKLLTRIYNPNSGNIYIDDIEIQSITLESLRQNICIVPQTVSIFDGSIMSNIKYARESGSDEEAMDACKAAGIHDDIMKNSEGYGTIVGKNGIKLSGGQEQRIGIARALFKNAKILLMDEPTSALDLVTENIIRDSLKTAKVTKFIVTHRLTMARDATRILVLQDGKFVESGTHDELVKKQGMYNSLWSAHTDSQSST